MPAEIQVDEPVNEQETAGSLGGTGIPLAQYALAKITRLELGLPV